MITLFILLMVPLTIFIIIPFACLWMMGNKFNKKNIKKIYSILFWEKTV